MFLIGNILKLGFFEFWKNINGESQKMSNLALTPHVSQNMNKRKLNTYNLCSQIDLIIS